MSKFKMRKGGCLSPSLKTNNPTGRVSNPKLMNLGRIPKIPNLDMEFILLNKNQTKSEIKYMNNHWSKLKKKGNDKKKDLKIIKERSKSIHPNFKKENMEISSARLHSPPELKTLSSK
mmetsp:Transcript_23709/g.21072  ORF Transcript_23709/g.21072 Transcript_23709/m.21072 type:complete len:118 (-) Transcript_23709:977-1330(-)